MFWIIIRLKICKRLACRRIVGVNRIDMRFLIDLSKPFLCLIHHIKHMIVIRTEHDIFAVSVLNMLVKQHIEIFSFLQCTAKCFKHLFGGITSSLVFSGMDTLFVFFKVLLIRKNREYIFRRSENASHNSFTERHFACNISVKKLVRHITLIVEIADSSCRQPKHRHIWICFQNRINASTPKLCAAPVKFVEDYVVGLYFSYFSFTYVHQLCVCIELDIIRLITVRSFSKVFKLCLIYVSGRREPAYRFVWIVLAEFEADETLARTCRVDHGSFTTLVKHMYGGFICSFVMLK